MQTFLPEPGFAASARALDDRRLFNQINEAQIIYRTLTGYYEERGKKGWPNHPATKMWAGCEAALNAYRNACIRECMRRGLTCNFPLIDPGNRKPKMPCWWGDHRIHDSHKSQLIARQPAFYKRKWPKVAEGMSYYWPTNDSFYLRRIQDNYGQQCKAKSRSQDDSGSQGQPKCETNEAAVHARDR